MSQHENDLAADVIMYIAACGGFAWRNNSGAAKIGKRFIRFGAVGSPDVCGVLPDGRFVGVECKSEKGKPTPAQVEFGERVRASKGVYIVAREYEDVVSGLDAAARGAR